MTGVSNKRGAGAKPAPIGHSRFGASGADRWIECPGSVKAQEGMLNESSVYAQEGTAGHAVAASCLLDGHDAIEFVGRTIEGVEIDDEIAEAVQLYVDTVRDDKAERGGKLIIERRFHLDWLDPEFYGTSDCAAVGLDNTLRVYDLKLGKGKAVEVEGNRQLCYYALGVIGTLPKTLRVGVVELVIVQPRRPHRDGPVRRWRIDPSHLLDYCQDLVDAAKLARSDNPPFKAGDHCGFCRAAGVCPTLRAKAFEQAQMDFREVDHTGDYLPEQDQRMIPPTIGHNLPPPDPMAMTTEELGRILDAADVIETWLSAVRGRAETLANAGEQIPGWKLVARRAMRKWREDTDVASALLLDFGLDESSIMVQKLRSPAQVEKLLPKPERAALAALYAKESSGNKLARASDPRDAALPQATLDFSE